MKKITCDHVREQLSDYIDGTLSAEEADAVKEHLVQCGACRDEAEELRLIVTLLQDIPETPIPARFDLAFKRALKQEIAIQNKKHRKKPVWKIMSGAAAVMVVGVLSLAMLQDGLHFSEKDLASGHGVDESSMMLNYGAVEKDTGDAEGQDGQATSSALGAYDDGCDSAAAPDQKECAREEISPSKVANGLIGGVESNISSYNSKIPESQLPQTAAKSKTDENASAGAADGGGLMAASDSAAAGAAPYAQPESRAATDAGMSRGGGFSSQDEYKAACEDWIARYTEAVNAKDASLFADIVATGGINGYTTDTARSVLKLYEDYLGTDEITYKQLRCSSEKMENSYVLEGGRRQIRVDMKNTADGLKVTETLLNHGPWLAAQMEGAAYFFEGYEVRDGGAEIAFHVKVDEPSGEEAAEGGAPEKQQVKEIVWKKTE